MYFFSFFCVFLWVISWHLWPVSAGIFLWFGLPIALFTDVTFISALARKFVNRWREKKCALLVCFVVGAFWGGH